MNAFARSLLLMAPSVLCTAAAAAQRVELQVDRALSATLTAATSPKRKSPAIAGVLSVWVPGAGSFYAGNNKHGAIHLGLHGIGTSLLLGAAAIPDQCSGHCQDGYVVAAVAGIVIVPVNWIWSVVTAVDDAQTHNRALDAAPRPVVGNLFFSPEIRLLGFDQKGTTRRIGAQAFSWRF